MSLMPPLWHDCDLHGLANHVSPLLILDEDLVQHGCSRGSQGILQLLQEVGVHGKQLLPQGKEEGRDGARAWAQTQTDHTRGKSCIHAPEQIRDSRRLSPWKEEKRSEDLLAHLDVDKDGLDLLRLEESL